MCVCVGEAAADTDPSKQSLRLHRINNTRHLKGRRPRHVTGSASCLPPDAPSYRSAHIATPLSAAGGAFRPQQQELRRGAAAPRVTCVQRLARLSPWSPGRHGDVTPRKRAQGRERSPRDPDSGFSYRFARCHKRKLNCGNVAEDIIYTNNLK